MDYYSILGVDKSASSQDIKRAYRKLASKHHPDKGGDGKLFQKIQEAYDTLGDENNRQQYDNPQPQFQFNSQHFQDINDIFSMFGQAGGGRRPQNRDVTIAAEINLEDVLYGKQLIAAYRLRNGREENVNIDIPPGARHGDTIRYEGLGDDTDPRVPRGNLNVKIHINNHPVWRREGVNLIKTEQVNVFDLLLGCTVIIKTIDNKNIKLTIPRGTKPGTKFSMNGFGLPDMRSRRRGSAYIVVEALIPEISKQETLDKLREIKNEINS